MTSSRNKVFFSFLMLALILVVGTGGYMLIEGASFLDSLFMAVITITTVGYEEVFKLSAGGKYFTIFLILIGVGYVLYMIGEVTETMVEGGMRRILGRNNMQKKVAELKDHYIVCGFGRIGKVICKNLKDHRLPFVVIENSPDEIQKIDELGYLSLAGNASTDDMLIKAGIKEARGLIAVVSSDAENVYIILSAKGINPNLFVMARSSGDDGSETKLLRAGADKVISPYYIGACRMAQLVVRPTVVDFLDLAVHGGELGLRMEELRVSGQSSLANVRLMDSGLRKQYDLIVVAIKREHGEMLFNPNPQALILPGDILIVLGDHQHIIELEKHL
ncbi:MAG: potassium channel protein [Desulfobulbaceae bacterium]|nr:potassium channel protein [Desulfobulbaceae bacterium]HIJ78076.1 potassium channel protein [Deltaproteobacteria bacterium]